MYNVIIYVSYNIKINFNHSVFLMKIKDTQFSYYFAEINLTTYSRLPKICYATQVSVLKFLVCV